MAGMTNCMRFHPKASQEEALFKVFAEYMRDYPFVDIMHHIIDLGTGEYALIGVHHSVESFIEIMNRENRVSDLIAFCRLCAS
ncbi:hypothetical protein OAO92_05825 [Paracoccaceae bacterium]|nr:hypothetical protein [Paracoccaceae bacterium]